MTSFLKCFFCGEPLIHIKSACIEFGDYEPNKNLLAWPGNGSRIKGWQSVEHIALFSHSMCGTEFELYWIGFDRLKEPFLLEHLRSKSWWWKGDEQAFNAARDFLNKMRP